MELQKLARHALQRASPGQISVRHAPQCDSASMVPPPLRRHAIARYMLWACVCLSGCHKSEFYQNG